MATVPRLAVAFALVGLDLDLDVLGLVGQIVGILDRRVIGLGVVGHHVVDVLRLLGFGEELGFGQGGRCSGRRGSVGPTAQLALARRRSATAGRWLGE